MTEEPQLELPDQDDPDLGKKIKLLVESARDVTQEMLLLRYSGDIFGTRLFYPYGGGISTGPVYWRETKSAVPIAEIGLCVAPNIEEAVRMATVTGDVIPGTKQWENMIIDIGLTLRILGPIKTEGRYRAQARIYHRPTKS